MVATVLSDTVVSVSDLKKNPMQVVAQGAQSQYTCFLLCAC